MSNVGWLSLAVLSAYGCAAVAPLVRSRLRGRVGALAGWCLVPVVLACPLLIPSANVGLRAASAFAAGDITFKMVESFRHRGHGVASSLCHSCQELDCSALSGSFGGICGLPLPPRGGCDMSNSS